VVRGEDLLRSTARQLLLYKALRLPIPQFFHCPLVRDESGKRLAKRDAKAILVNNVPKHIPDQIITMNTTNIEHKSSVISNHIFMSSYDNSGRDHMTGSRSSGGEGLPSHHGSVDVRTTSEYTLRGLREKGWTPHEIRSHFKIDQEVEKMILAGGSINNGL